VVAGVIPVQYYGSARRRLEASIQLLESALSGLRKVQVELAAYIAKKNSRSK